MDLQSDNSKEPALPKSQFSILFPTLCQHGTWASEDPVSAEKCQKQAEMKKAKGHDQKTAAKAALVFTCSVCRSQMPDPKTFKQHFESKHPKSPLPPELEGVEA
ncbi:hypothetical protein INR49_002513 [Caranx melampygus]|nr:hypothetical protein INR49_002513 [Caranx melampygus]